MTIASEANRSGPYACNGATTRFPFAFKIYDEAHIRVILTDPAGVEADLDLGPDYTVMGVGDDGGGAIVVTTAPPAGHQLTLVLDVPFTQATDLENQGAFFAETIERSFDLLTQQALQLKELVARSVVLPVTSMVSVTELVNATLALAKVQSQMVSLVGIAPDIETVAGITAEVVAAQGNAQTATSAAVIATTKAGEAAASVVAAAGAADRAEVAARTVEGVVSYAVEQDLTTEEKAQAQANLGLEGLRNALTPFGFTATTGQTAFDLGMSPLPSACIFSLNGAWLTGGGVDYTVAGSTLTLATPAEAGDRISGVAIAPFTVANAMLSAANLADLADVAVARANLGLGAAAVLGAGTGANELLKLDAAGKLPAVPGDQLMGVGRKLISSTAINAATSADIVLPTVFSKFEVELLGHAGNNTLQLQMRLAGGGVLSGAADYKGVAQARGTGVVTLDNSAGAAFHRLSNTNYAWVDLLVELDNLTGFLRSIGWAAGNEFSSIGRVQTAGPYDLLRLTPNTGTLTCMCKLFGIRDAS